MKRAEELLVACIKEDPKNIEYWLWLSKSVESPKDKVYCLNQVLDLDPYNQDALRDQSYIFELEDYSEDYQPEFLKNLAKQEESETPKSKSILSQRPIRVFTYTLAAIFVIVVFISVLSSLRKKPLVIEYPTRTPGILTTFTQTATDVPGGYKPTATSTPFFEGPRPLWMSLSETYTPTPMYVNTPHPISEAFTQAMLAFDSKDWDKAIEYFEQAIDAEPNFPDILYHLGEAYRLNEDFKSADLTYDRALEINPRFAPAFLGKAKVAQYLEKSDQINSLLTKAIELDENMIEAYIERADRLIQADLFEEAEKDLNRSENLGYGSARLYLLRSEIELVRGENEKAYLLSKRAMDMDKTYLPIYLMHGWTCFETSRYHEAIYSANQYTTYKEDDSKGWYLLGRIYLAMELDPKKAIGVLTKAYELDSEDPAINAYLGAAKNLNGNYKAGVKFVERAIEIDPESFVYISMLATIHWVNGDFQKALIEIEKAFPYADTDEYLGKYYYIKGSILIQSGERDAGLELLRKILELPPGSVGADIIELVKKELEKGSGG